MAAKKTISTVSKLEQKIQKLGLSEEELNTFLRQMKTPQKHQSNTHHRTYNLGRTRVGVLGDMHVGHKNFRYDIFEDAVQEFKREGVDVVYQVGDIIEGMSGREGHIYELELLGVSAQVKRAAELLNHLTATTKAPLEFILGNHDLWAMKKENQGYNIGEDLQNKVKGSTYLGDMVANIVLNGGVQVRLSHEGSSAYALSYSMQKRINALQPGTKPNVIFNGHIHKQLYMFYRNIHAFEVGCLEDQTEFMAMKGSPAHTGFQIVDLHHTKDGELRKVVPTFYPYY